jgi:predicted Ser/Thr protein kinase
MTATPEIAAATMVDRYRIESRIGAGGMGEVYKAFDCSLERAVALKVLPVKLVGDAERVLRFAQEAKAASALNHPNIVTIYDIGQARREDGTGEGATVHYIAMEYIEGRTLRAFMRGGRPLGEVLTVLAQAADGLAKAHAAGIVHRDLKPDNIMVTSDGYAKIVDFGLAKLIDQKRASSDPQLTRTGFVMGTAGYMSPEQVEGKTIQPASDMFSFGCILYECVTGKRPFDGELAIDTLQKIVFEEPAPIHALAPEAPNGLQTIIDRCLKKEPTERYATMRELASALRGIDLSSPIAADEVATARVAAHSLSDPAAAVAALPPFAPPLEVTNAAPASPHAPRRVAPRVFSAAYWTLVVAAIATTIYLWATMPDLTPLRERASASPQYPAALRHAAIAAHDPIFRERKPLKGSAGQQVAQLATFAFRPDRRHYLPSPLTRAAASQLYGGETFKPLRALRAWVIAAAMERDLSRERIVELYLDRAPIGPSIGAAAAAEKVFAKPPRRLTRAEAALLAAASTSPEFDPAAPTAELKALQARLDAQLARAGIADTAPTAAKPKKTRSNSRAKQRRR